MRYSLLLLRSYYYGIPVFWTGLNLQLLFFFSLGQTKTLYRLIILQSQCPAHFSTAKCRAAFTTATKHSFLTATEPGKPCREAYDLCRVSGTVIGSMDFIMHCSYA